MPQLCRSATAQPCFAGWKMPLPLALGFGISLVWCLGGISCLAIRQRDAQGGPLLASAGIVIIGCALLQLRLLCRAWRGGRIAAAENPFAQFAFWRSLAIGALILYLAVLTLPAVRHVGAAWLAAVCLWQSMLLLPLAAPPKVVNDWRKWTDSRTSRRISWLVYGSILMLLLGEAGLRVQRAAQDGQWFALHAGPSQALAAALDVRVTHLNPGQFRVAILGAEATGTSAQTYFARVEETLPGLDIVSLHPGLTDATRGTSELAAKIAGCDADLVLAVVPVCEDLARQPPERGYFDWRRYELTALVFGASEPETFAAPDAAAADFESYLRGLAPQLAACRTPINDAMHERWQQVHSSLDRVIEGCREARVPVALVIVPAEFQVNRDLCATLLRRYGLSAERFDVELPQRRLAGFAAQRDVPLVDLLPHLRLCRQSAYQRHATALSEEGNSVAATAIGGWLESRFAGQFAAQLSKAR